MILYIVLRHHVPPFSFHVSCEKKKGGNRDPFDELCPGARGWLFPAVSATKPSRHPVMGSYVVHTAANRKILYEILWEKDRGVFAAILMELYFGISIYPLVNSHDYGKSPLFMGNQLFLWPCSITISIYQRVMRYNAILDSWKAYQPTPRKHMGWSSISWRVKQGKLLFQRNRRGNLQETRRKPWIFPQKYGDFL